MPFSVPRAFVHTAETNPVAGESIGIPLVPAGLAGIYAGTLFGLSRGWWRSALLREIVPWGIRGAYMGAFFASAYTVATWFSANYITNKDTRWNMVFGGAATGLIAGASSMYNLEGDCGIEMVANSFIAQSLFKVLSWPVAGAMVGMAFAAGSINLEDRDITRKYASPFPTIRGETRQSIWAWPHGPNSVKTE